MRIDVSRLETGALDFERELELAPDRLDADQVAAPVTVRLKGSVRPIAAGFRVEGELAASGSLLCARCLQPVAWRTEERFRLELWRALDPSAGDDDSLDESEMDRVLLDDDQLDLDQLAAEQVLLALPMRALCRDDCAGLCPICGADRNLEGACGCEPEIDPRLAPLRDLSGRSS